MPRKDNETMLRNILKVIRYGFAGSILAIAFVQGFFPELDISSMWPGVAGFGVAAISSAKALAVL